MALAELGTLIGKIFGYDFARQETIVFVQTDNNGTHRVYAQEIQPPSGTHPYGTEVMFSQNNSLSNSQEVHQ